MACLVIACRTQSNQFKGDKGQVSSNSNPLQSLALHLLATTSGLRLPTRATSHPANALFPAMVSKQTESEEVLQNLGSLKLKDALDLVKPVKQTELEIAPAIQKLLDDKENLGALRSALEQMDPKTQMMLNEIEERNVQLAGFDDNTTALQEEMRASAKLREKLALEAMDEFLWGKDSDASSGQTAPLTAATIDMIYKMVDDISNIKELTAFLEKFEEMVPPVSNKVTESEFDANMEASTGLKKKWMSVQSQDKAGLMAAMDGNSVDKDEKDPAADFAEFSGLMEKSRAYENYQKRLATLDKDEEVLMHKMEKALAEAGLEQEFEDFAQVPDAKPLELEDASTEDARLLLGLDEAFGQAVGADAGKD